MECICIECGLEYQTTIKYQNNHICAFCLFPDAEVDSIAFREKVKSLQKELEDTKLSLHNAKAAAKIAIQAGESLGKEWGCGNTECVCNENGNCDCHNYIKPEGE